jgi:hypothetical protein
MKVKEFIELLKKEDPESMVIMSCDSEGNQFTNGVAIGNGTIYKEDLEKYYIDSYDSEDEDDYEAEDGTVKVICLYP